MNEVRSPEQIEREINELRGQISDTLDAVQQKLSPGEMLDQALTYARGGSAIAANVGRGMKDSPLSAALAALSLGWLWYSGSRGQNKGARHGEDATVRQLLETLDDLERTKDDLLRMRDTTVSYVRANPLATAAIAVTAGAIISALIPRKRR